MDSRRRLTVMAAAAVWLTMVAAGCSSGAKGPGVAQLTTPGSAASGSGSAAASAPAGSSPATAAAKGKASLLDYSKCMRANGVPDFPDPVGGSLRIQASPGSDLDFNSPHMVAAQKACKSLQPAGTADGPVNAAAKTQALQYSACMRSHGVPNFPDPIFSSDGGTQLKITGIDPHSPQFVAATTACQSLQPGGNGAGSDVGATP
jgi:hypothetical protein